MEKSALAQEKVWFDKPSYDKAERLYFERMAKVSIFLNVIGYKIANRNNINVSKHTN